MRPRGVCIDRVRADLNGKPIEGAIGPRTIGRVTSAARNAQPSMWPVKSTRAKSFMP